VPRKVDHEQRRSEVTSIAAELVARGGRGALTVRGVAEAAGCSTTVVSHYFDDMSHLLHETYALSVRRSRRRVDAVIALDPYDLVGLVEAVLPLDARRTDDWRIWLAFWGDALASSAFAREQRQRARTATRRFRTCLDLLVAQGRLPASLDTEVAADRISVLVPGIAAEAIFDPRRWTAARQRRVLLAELAALGLDAATTEVPAPRRAS
jgi:AcrR family transcriptional regulator